MIEGVLGQGEVTAETAIMKSPQSTIFLVVVGLAVLLCLGVVVRHRLKMQSNMSKSKGTAAVNEPEPTMTRPLMAILLVGSVVILAAASLTFADAETRNILVGAIVSLSSAVVAFYFASSGATEARRDLLAATGELQAVPDLVGKTVNEALAIMGSSHLALVLPEKQPPGSTVKTQDPKAGATVTGTRSVKVTLHDPAGSGPQ
jgi:PASTA domain